MRLYEILEAVLYDNSLCLIVQMWEVGDYDEHFLAYEAKNRLGLVDIICIEVFDSQPISLHRIGNTYMFRTKNNYNNSS